MPNRIYLCDLEVLNTPLLSLSHFWSRACVMFHVVLWFLFILPFFQSMLRDRTVCPASGMSCISKYYLVVGVYPVVVYCTACIVKVRDACFLNRKQEVNLSKFY